MNDSFSKLAKKIRQNKINKKEIQNIKKEIIDEKVYNIIKNDMAIRIQKCVRGFLYRKKFNILLDQINTETIINYLYEKKLNRIRKDYNNIISEHITNYIQNIREEKEKINQQKIYCIELIKATLRGMILRKKFRNEICSLQKLRNIIERYILGYKIKLILRSNNIQSLLTDISNIKYSLNNIDKTLEANNPKIKELKTKLTKNINLFYFTFYQMKENSNWISQTKIKEPWIQKYMNIINKEENDKNNNIFVKKKSIYSNQKKIKRLKENKENNNKNNDNKNVLRSTEYRVNSKTNIMNKDKDKDNEINNINNNEKESLKNDNVNNDLNKENKDNNNSINNFPETNKTEKNYNFNFYDSENDELYENRKILHKGTDIYINKNSKNEFKKTNTLKDDEMNINLEENINDDKDKRIKSSIVKRYKAKKAEEEQKMLNKKQSNSFDNKEDNINKKDKEISEFSHNEENETNKNINEEKKIPDIDIEKEREKEKEKEKEKKPKKLNKYQQREERPIKPLTNNNFLENENPFGLRKESSEVISENQNLNLNQNKNSIEKKIISSTRAINRAMVNYNQKNKNKKQNISEIEKEETTIKTQEKTDLSHEEAPISNKYIDYDNRPCGGGSTSIYNNKYSDEIPKEKIDRNERPLAGQKKIDYNAMFGEGDMEFEGDPFGGAKQYESSNKDKVKNANLHKTNTIKKKPVYDARKAIEEAKIKEAKEGKKEKPSAFREFLREMKKISAEEKIQHNETNTDIKNEKKIKNSKNKKNDIKNNNLELNTESNINKDKKIEKNKAEKLNTEEKIQKKTNVFQDKKINMNSENEDKNDLNTEENQIKRRHRGTIPNKGTETKEIALRRKLHELEKAPAPVLNIKGIKSRIECWGNSNENKKTKINSIGQKAKEKTKSRDEKKAKMNKDDEQKIISNFISSKKVKEFSESNNNNNTNNNNNNENYSSVSCNNIPRISKNMEEKIEKYVDKKLMQLNLQIEEIDELFNLENYFKEKEDKMKQYISLPYIKENYDFINNFSNEDYDEKMEQIEKVYKELK